MSRIVRLIKMILLGGFLIKLADLLFGKKEREIKVNFAKFWNEEKNEFHKLARGADSPKIYRHKSVAIFKDYFLPHSGNSHKPKLLHGKTLALIAVLAILVKASFLGYFFYSYSEYATMSVALENDIMELINKERIAMNLPEIAPNEVLRKSALAKANDMISKDYFAHFGPDGTKPWDWINRSEYKYLFVGENLAINFMSAESVHKALMASPSHKKNILNEKYQEAGIAVVSGILNGQQTNILVQLFAVEQKTTLALAVNTDKTAAGSTDVTTVDDKAIEVLSEETIIKEEKLEDSPVLEDDIQNETPTTEEVLKPEIEEIAESNTLAIEDISEPEIEEIIEVEEEIVVKQAFNESGKFPPSEYVEDDVYVIRQSALGTTSIEGYVKPDNLDELIYLASIGPNVDLLQGNFKETIHPNTFDDKSLMIANIGKSFLFTLLGLITFVLVFTIIVHSKLQHKTMVIQSLLVIILISGLLYVKLHFLENGLSDIILL